MTLSYAQQFRDGSPTMFREKILKAACENMIQPVDVETDDILRHQLMSNYDSLQPKLHTIREDFKNMWPPKTGLIHHCYDSRTPNRKCFLTSPCVSVQRIVIMHAPTGRYIMVDGRMMQRDSMEAIALNDGFRDLEHFFTWFNKSFAGKIIHFTNLRY